MNFEYVNSELQILNIRIMSDRSDLTQNLWVILAKFQSPVVTVTAMICKTSKNSEKFELQTSNIEFQISR